MWTPWREWRACAPWGSRAASASCSEPEWSSQIVPKGSVTLDGISLTVNDCGPGFLEVNIIPETWRVTTVAFWRPGSAVNLETDVIGKYVKHLMQPYAPRRQGSRGARDHGLSAS